MPMSRRQLEHLARQLPAIVTALSAHRRNKAAVQLVGVYEIRVALAGHGIEVTDGDLAGAISIAVDRGTLRTEGDPPHSVTAYV